MDIQVEPWRLLLNAAEQQILDRIITSGAHVRPNVGRQSALEGNVELIEPAVEKLVHRLRSMMPV